MKIPSQCIGPTMEDSSPSQNHNGQIGTSGGSLNVGNKQNEEGNQRTQYSIPGILHFIQHEWARFEMERSQWEVDRAELQARIAFLQGERKGQENLKNDLVRRIKMLEYALKQERAKYHKLKYGSELQQGDMKPPMFDEPVGVDEPVDGEVPFTTVSNVSWRQGRQLLRQYLQEIGYTDTIIDVRSNRVRSLLGLNNNAESEENLNNSGVVSTAINGNESSNKRASENQGRRTPAKKTQPSALTESMILDTEAAVMANFEFLAQKLQSDDADGDSNKNSFDDDTEPTTKTVLSPNQQSATQPTNEGDDSFFIQYGGRDYKYYFTTRKDEEDPIPPTLSGFEKKEPKYIYFSHTDIFPLRLGWIHERSIKRRERLEADPLQGYRSKPVHNAPADPGLELHRVITSTMMPPMPSSILNTIRESRSRKINDREKVIPLTKSYRAGSRIRSPVILRKQFTPVRKVGISSSSKPCNIESEAPITEELYATAMEQFKRSVSGTSFYVKIIGSELVVRTPPPVKITDPGHPSFCRSSSLPVMPKKTQSLTDSKPPQLEVLTPYISPLVILTDEIKARIMEEDSSYPQVPRYIFEELIEFSTLIKGLDDQLKYKHKYEVLRIYSEPRLIIEKQTLRQIPNDSEPCNSTSTSTSPSPPKQGGILTLPKDPERERLRNIAKLLALIFPDDHPCPSSCRSGTRISITKGFNCINSKTVVGGSSNVLPSASAVKPLSINRTVRSQSETLAILLADVDMDDDDDMIDDLDDQQELDDEENVKTAKRKAKTLLLNEGLADDVDAEAEEVLHELNLLTESEDVNDMHSAGDPADWGVGAGMGFQSAGGHRRPLGVGINDEEVLDSTLGLGELAQLTVNNEAEAAYDIASTKDSYRKTWNAKYTLRSHFDGVRALAFHPIEPVLITASEDHTLKLWNLQKTVPAKKSASLDVEPLYTFRCHSGPVLCLSMGFTGESCYSGGLDGAIHCWSLPDANIDPYDSFDPSVLTGSLEGHTDAVWALSLHNQRSQLLSSSSDGSVKLWSPTTSATCLSTYTSEADGWPTSVDFVRDEPNRMVAAYNSGACIIYDLETAKPLVRLETNMDDNIAVNRQINCVVAHPTLPLTMTAHEDRHIRFFDNNTGKLVHWMVAHLDSVTSMAVDPNGLYLLSGSHDCSIRLWNLDNKTCVQEITAHRKKFDESIFDVAFHPSRPYIASAGADGLAKVFV